MSPSTVKTETGERMTEILFQLAGGTVFLALAAGLTILIATGYLVRGSSGVRILQGLFAPAIAGFLLSAPPLPRGLLPVWLVLALAWWAETEWRSRKGLRISGAAGGVLALATCGLVLLELPRLRAPALPAETIEIVHVVGDSLSAGIGGETHTWPDLLAEETGIPVTNRASPGARLSDGIAQVPEAGDQPGLVLVLLGGNDVLWRASSADFTRDLRALLERLAETEHHVVFFELPVVAGFRSYGRIQRRLARDYDIPLIPARILSRVLSAQGSTSDGIHLTENGHRRLADRVAGLFDPVVIPEPAHTAILPVAATLLPLLYVHCRRRSGSRNG